MTDVVVLVDDSTAFNNLRAVVAQLFSARIFAVS